MRMVQVMVLLLGLAVPADELSQQVLRSSVSTVEVYVSVTDRAGSPILGLAKSSFTVLEDGKRRPIGVFAADRQPLTTVLLLDESPTLLDAQPRVRAAGAAFLSTLDSADVGYLGRFTHLIRVSPVPIRGPEHFTALLGEELDEFPAGTALWDGLGESISVLANAAVGRRAVVVVTDGLDNSSLTTAAAVRRRLEETGILVYAVGLKGEKGLPAAGLSDLARSSGGRLIELRSGDDPALALATIATELRSQYLLGFEPTTLDGKSHKIEVKVQAPGSTVRSRTSYIAKP